MALCEAEACATQNCFGILQSLTLSSPSLLAVIVCLQELIARAVEVPKFLSNACQLLNLQTLLPLLVFQDSGQLGTLAILGDNQFRISSPLGGCSLHCHLIILL